MDEIGKIGLKMYVSKKLLSPYHALEIARCGERRE